MRYICIVGNCFMSMGCFTDLIALAECHYISVDMYIHFSCSNQGEVLLTSKMSNV